MIWCRDYITDIPKCHEIIDVIESYSKKYKSYIVTYNSLTKEDIKWIYKRQLI